MAKKGKKPKSKKRRKTRTKNVPLYKRKVELSTYRKRKIYFGEKKIPKSHVCIYCGKRATSYHIDHKNPRANGGSNRRSNLVVACSTCNLTKGDNSIRQWLRRIRSSKNVKHRSLYKKIINNNKRKKSSIAKAVRQIRDTKVLRVRRRRNKS